MTKKNYFTASDISEGDSIRRLIDKKNANVLCCFSGTVLETEDLGKYLLVIAFGPEQVVSLLKNDQLPGYTPILYLGEGDCIPEPIKNFRSSRIMDYLPLPCAISIFLHRIDLLLQVQKISAEHYAHRTTLSRQLNLLTTRDGLTGLFNRRTFTKNLTQTLKIAQKEQRDLSLLLLNIDYFNSINKTSGLECGDAILNELAARLTQTIDKEATCYRFSGEDFVILLPEADLRQACTTAEKIRKACAEKPFTDGNTTTSLTISVGIASLQDHLPDNDNAFICMAETALFMAKAEGRNRLQVYIPHHDPKEISLENSLACLRDNLQRILEKTKTSALASLQLLAKNVAGSAHQAHIDKVSHYVALLGQQLGLPEQHTQTFQNSITLYNSFRFLLHHDLLSKPERLTSDERKIIEDLPFKSNELTDMFDYFNEERNVLLGHNERYDGTGYPLGLRGDEISLGSRIFTIVDSLAAMNSERPYRRKLTPTEIIDELKKEAGKQFDPYLVLQILTVIKKNQLLQINTDFLDQTQQDLVNIFPQLIS
jgi:diguanylate cyclase (GGDEF)-like protein